MVYLSANHYSSCFVGHEEVSRGDVFGDWKRFSYYCNWNKLYIYCRNQAAFFRLFACWCSWANCLPSVVPSNCSISAEDWKKIKYVYTLGDVEGVSISSSDVIMDNPDSKPFRVKSYIQSQHGEYIQ